MPLFPAQVLLASCPPPGLAPLVCGSETFCYREKGLPSHGVLICWLSSKGARPAISRSLPPWTCWREGRCMAVLAGRAGPAQGLELLLGSALLHRSTPAEPFRLVKEPSRQGLVWLRKERECKTTSPLGACTPHCRQACPALLSGCVPSTQPPRPLPSCWDKEPFHTQCFSPLAADASWFGPVPLT